jgi:hypothetical protein
VTAIPPTLKFNAGQVPLNPETAPLTRVPSAGVWRVPSSTRISAAVSTVPLVVPMTRTLSPTFKFPNVSSPDAPRILVVESTITVLPLTTKVWAIVSIEAIAPSALSGYVGAGLAVALAGVAGVEGVGEETVTVLGPQAIIVTMVTAATATDSRSTEARLVC